MPGPGRGSPLAPGTAFLVGLLSLLDALLDVPLAQALRRLRLAADIERALLHRAGPFGGLLEDVVSLERGALEGLDGMSAPRYADACAWADAAAHAALA